MSVKLNSLSKISRNLYGLNTFTFKHLFIIIHKIEFPSSKEIEYFEDDKNAIMVLSNVILSIKFKNKNRLLESINYMNLIQKINIIRKLIAIIWNQKQVLN
jgi:hypothetical protein